MNTTRKPDDPSRRSIAEWTSLTVSLSIILTLVGLLAYDYIANGNAPPIIDVRPDLTKVRQSADRYYLPVTVKNTGSAAVTTVQIEITLEGTGEGTESTNFTIDFLDGGETADAVAVFESDPAQGTVQVGAISYLEP